MMDGNRSEQDLDSLTVGSETKGRAKIYFNWREDKVEDVQLKLQEMLKAARMSAYLNG